MPATHEERHRIEHISEDQLQSQLVNPEASSDPSKESIDGIYERKDRQDISSVAREEQRIDESAKSRDDSTLPPSRTNKT